MTKHIFVTGGVVSSLGKGLTSASIGMLLLACGIITWCVAYLLHTGLVDLSLASYSPLTNRILFGNKQYQQLFDRANQYMPKKRSTPSLRASYDSTIRCRFEKSRHDITAERARDTFTVMANSSAASRPTTARRRASSLRPMAGS